jgi:hypothetical protein
MICARANHIFLSSDSRMREAGWFLCVVKTVSRRGGDLKFQLDHPEAAQFEAGYLST